MLSWISVQGVIQAYYSSRFEVNEVLSTCPAIAHRCWRVIVQESFAEQHVNVRSKVTIMLFDQLSSSHHAKRLCHCYAL